MSGWSTVLKLVANAVGVCNLEPTFDKLQAFECSVYLAQGVGVDLGYQFIPINGLPHSRELMVDFDEMLREGPTAKTAELDDEAKLKLEGLASATTPPSEIAMTADTWIRLLAAYDVSKKSIGSSTFQSEMELSNPLVIPFLERAEEKLRGIAVAV